MVSPKIVLDEIPANTTVEAVVDEDIRVFDQEFQRIGNSPIVPSERAIIKTYLAWKLGLAKGMLAPPAEPEEAPQEAG